MFCSKINKNISEIDCTKVPKNLPAKKVPEETEEKSDELVVSDSIVERIENDGSVTEERLACYDNHWIEKLAELDRSHTEEKLNPRKAEVILNKLEAYTRYRAADPCENNALALMRCYTMFEKESIKCDEYAKSFIKCVDKSLRDAVFKANTTPQPSDYKKMTYAKRFSEGFY